ncbi:MAG: ABC transporter permease, partial [Chloroflexi bacterium]
LGGAGVIAPFHLPDTLANLPLIGPILVMFLDQGPIAMSVLFIVILLQIALFRTKWGLRTRAVGEHPKAADTVGIDVYRQRYQNVIFGCALAGLAGAFLTLESTGSFQNGMTGGRGFIALAAMIFGRWTPIGAFGGALLFGTATALGVVINVRVPEGDLGTVLKSIPTFWYAALPYLMTIVILAGVVGRSTPPAADGVPYVKEGKG